MTRGAPRAEYAIEFLQLASDDDAASVSDRLRFMRGRRVALVWPETGDILTRKLDLVLVQREAIRHNVRIAIVTHSAQTIHNASDLDISAFETIPAARRGRWKRGRSRAFINRSKRPINSPLADELAPFASRVRAEELDTPRSKAKRIAARLVTLLLIIGVLLAVAYVVLPYAEIRLIPAFQTLEVSTRITADSTRAAADIDIENALMPATIFRAEIEDRGTIATTGQQTLTNTPAVGSVTFINLTEQRLDIPAGSLVSTSAGTPIVFRTTADGVLQPGIGEQAVVAIEAVAESYGTVGNVAAGLINTVIGPLGEQVEVRNFSALFGGENRSAGIVTSADRDTLIAVLRQQIQDRAFRDLAPLAADDQVLILETIRIVEERTDWMTFSHEVGDVADSLTLTMRVVVGVTAISEDVARQVGYARLSAQVPRGRAILENSLAYGEPENITVDAQGRISFDLFTRAQAEAVINAAQLHSRLAGLSIDEALAYLQQNTDLQPGSTAEIALSPAWLGRMPIIPLRISTNLMTLAQAAPAAP
ncbi:MAG: baseplate J/gp47 family protein [Pleurocapsa minor GSE-CHR-MK-17-07R]|nr:baseplate J/gp47 family protein [Pleurocapsa minor GSE-CHR-MK 17-07R]